MDRRSGSSRRYTTNYNIITHHVKNQESKFDVCVLLPLFDDIIIIIRSISVTDVTSKDEIIIFVTRSTIHHYQLHC